MSNSWAAKSAGVGSATPPTAAAKKDGGDAAAAAAAGASDAPAATAAASRSRLNYFLTFLRGSVVVAQLTDGSCVEGLFHTADLAAGAADSPALVLHMAQRQLDKWATSEESPRVYESTPSTPALPRNTTYPFEGSRKIALGELVHLSAAGINPAEWTSEYVEWAAKNAPSRAATVSGGPRGFATDSVISGASDKQRELVKWSDDGEGATTTAGLEWDARPHGGSAGGNIRNSSSGSFNQFETFERMTGKQSTFQFDDYSTPLDRNSKFYRENEARAEAIANSIQKSEAGSAHQMLEREGLEEGASRDRDADEGDLFSDVRRTAEQAPGKAGAYKPGAFGRQKQQAGGTPSKQPSPDVVAGPSKTQQPQSQQPNSATKAPKASPSPPAAAAGSAANGAVSASPESAPGGVPATSVSPKPIDISLAAQQKAAVIAASPKEPATSPAPAPTTPAASEPAASTATTTTTTAPASASPAPAAAASDAAAAASTSAASSSTTAAASSTTTAPATTSTPVKSSLSAKAKPFTLSAKAASFTPSAAPAAVAAPAPVPVSMPLMGPGGYMGGGAMGYPPGALPLFPGSPTGPGGIGMPMMPGVGGGMLPGVGGMPFGMPGVGGQGGPPPQMPQFSPQQLAQLTAQMMARGGVGAPLPGVGAGVGVGGMPPQFFPPPPPPAVLPQGVNVNSPQFAAMLQQQFMATMAANMAAQAQAGGAGAGGAGPGAFNPALFNPALFQQMQAQQAAQGRQNPQQPPFNPQQQQLMAQAQAMAQQHAAAAAAMARAAGGQQQQFQQGSPQQGNFRPQQPF